MKPDEINPYESPKADLNEGIDRPPPPDTGPPDADDLVRVTSYRYAAEADFAVLLLEQAGIDATLEDANLVTIDPLISNAVGGVKVLVRRAQLRGAAEILSEHQASLKPTRDLSEVEFDCEDCGAALKFPGKSRGRVETCPKCGEFVDVPD